MHRRIQPRGFIYLFNAILTLVVVFAFHPLAWPRVSRLSRAHQLFSSSVIMHAVLVNSTRGDRDGKEDFCEVVDDFGCQAVEYHNFSSSHKEQWIRLQAKPDLPEMSRDEILSRIHQVEKEQAEKGRADLLPREWEPTIINGADSRRVFSVLQFNVLAQGLSFGPHTQSPFEPTQKLQEYKAKNTYGGFTAVAHPEVCLDYQLRQWRLLQAIIDADTDIIGLEEMDRFHGFFQPMLKQFGYEGIFLPKLHSPGVKLGWYSDGSALFFRTSIFELEGSMRFSYAKGNQVCLVTRLLHKETKQVVKVAVTHLKAEQKQQCEETRKHQVEQMIQEFLVGGDENEVVIILGDFNTEPQSDSIKKMQTHYTSAYNLEDNSLVTTWKTRGSDTVRRVIDYIFYSNLKCTATLSIPLAEMEELKLPSLRYPSDHILIGAKFELPESHSDNSKD